MFKYKVNKILASKEILIGNNHTQRENFERFIEDIFSTFKYEI